MAKTIDAAKPSAGKKNGKKKRTTNSCIIAEIGKVYVTMEKIDGKFLIGFSTDCVDSDVNGLCDYANDEHGVQLEPELMFSECLGFVSHEVEPKAFDSIRKWIAKNTSWQLMREVKG